jgi:hypothetical protein
MPKLPAESGNEKVTSWALNVFTPIIKKAALTKIAKQFNDFFIASSVIEIFHRLRKTESLVLRIDPGFLFFHHLSISDKPQQKRNSPTDRRTQRQKHYQLGFSIRWKNRKNLAI